MPRETRAAATAQSSPIVVEPPALGSIVAGGDLGHRTAQNFARLQAAIYQPPLLWRQTNWQSWPGDFEGRALLALTLLSRATGQQPEYLPAMVAAYPAQLNPQGYFGPLLDLHAINEQQLSGHGWYLRALCELYEYQRASPAAIPTQTSEQTLAQILAIIRNLALPLRGKYAVYPIDPELRAQATAPANPGSVDGHLSGRHGDWAVSSDTGCAFIFLDGLAHAWVVLNAAHAPEAPELKALIDEAVARFAQIDLVAIKAQTHASLTATRALLRLYSATGETGLLRAAQSRYQLYRSTAMTANYANTNWFGRPDSWTEPCAIIDSFMIATQLWQHTSNPAYLEDAHLIWFNGVGRGLRSNGGFGTDTCVGYKSPFIKVRSYEAYFCCTMRGGEAHARAAQYLYFVQPTRLGVPVLTVPFFSDSNAAIDLGHGPVHLRQTTGYPYSGRIQIEIGSAAPQVPTRIRFFCPGWSTSHTLTLNGRQLRSTYEPSDANRAFLSAIFTPKPADVLVFSQKLRVGPGEPANTTPMPGYYSFHAGPLLLGYATPPDSKLPAPTLRSPDPAEVHTPRGATLTLTSAPATYRVSASNISLAPINDLNDTPATPHDPCPRQMLFRES